MKKGIIFDLDGTLWDARQVLITAWNDSLKKMGLDDRISMEGLTPCLGLPLEKIADRLFPLYGREKKDEIIKFCCEEQKTYLRKYGGRLYKNLKKALEILKEKYDLYIVSNCKSGYIESFLYAHNMEDFFEDFEDNGRTGLTKAENIRLVMKRNGIGKAFYTGDTQMDMEAAKKAEIPFVFAAYGFGSADGAQWKIKTPMDLINLAEEIFDE